MSGELKITKERVLEASEECPDAKVVLEKLFPEVFKTEWIDITEKIEWYLENYGSSDGNALYGRHKEKTIISSKGLTLETNTPNDPNVKIEQRGALFKVFRKSN